MLRLLTLITVTSITSLACADVLNVPGDYSSIGAAIAAANDGDEIHIADGTYTGAANRDLDLGAKNLVIKAVNRGAVTID